MTFLLSSKPSLPPSWVVLLQGSSSQLGCPQLLLSLLGGGEATEPSGCGVCRINGLFFSSVELTAGAVISLRFLPGKASGAMH